MELLEIFLSKFSTEALIEILTILTDSTCQIKEKDSNNNVLIIIEPITGSSISFLPFSKESTNQIIKELITKKIENLIIKYKDKITDENLSIQKLNFKTCISLSFPSLTNNLIEIQTNTLITKEFIITVYILELIKSKFKNS